MNTLRSIFKGLLCGVLFISAFFWSTVLTFAVDGAATSIVVISALLTNVVTGWLLAADSYRHIFYKWLIALPAGIITFFIYREINFVYYFLNKILPGYGNLSAGGGFAVLYYLAIFCLCFPVAIAIAAALTKRNRTKLNPAN